MMHHSLHLILTNMLIYFPTGGPFLLLTAFGQK